MGALLVSRISVRDPEAMKSYAVAAAPALAAYGGEVLARGAFATALLGADSPHATGILRFPDVAAVQAWFSSPEYQALTELRASAGEMELFVYETS